MWAKFFSGFVDLIYPPNCLLCRSFLGSSRPPIPVCKKCVTAIQTNQPPFCAKCSRRLRNTALSSYCPKCQRINYPFDCIWGITVYNPSMRRLIHLFKYGYKTALKRLFTQLMITFIERHHIPVKEFDIIVPVPLHPTRLRERGYNQAQLLADRLAEQFSIKPSFDNLIRVRHTQYQAALGPKERWTNIQGAFKIKDSSAVYGKSVLLVDDLLTTGATVCEAARALRASGAKNISILALSIAY